MPENRSDPGPRLRGAVPQMLTVDAGVGVRSRRGAWRGDINGHQPRLTRKKALIIQTTIFDKRAYDAGLRDAMRMVIEEFTLTYPGIKNVKHEYFYAVHGADDATRRGYLEKSMPWVASSERAINSKDCPRDFPVSPETGLPGPTAAKWPERRS